MYFKHYMLIILSYCHLNSSLIYKNLNQSVQNLISAKIISQFAEYNIIYHYQNKYKCYLDSILSNTRLSGTYLMANYDLHSDSSKIILRPTGYKYLHVILLENYTDFVDYTSANQFPLNYVDVLLFLTNLGSEERQNFELWDNNSLERAGGLFVLDYWAFKLCAVCFYCGDLEGELRVVHQFKNGATTVPELQGYVNKFTDFNNHVFKVGYIDYKPYFWAHILIQRPNYTLFDVQGSEGELLVLLHEQLNVDFKMTQFSGSSDVWVKLIEAVQNKTIDWAVGGITLTIQRSEIVDFTASIQLEPYTVLYSVYTDPWMAWQSIILPFQFLIWVTLISAVGIIATLFFLAFKMTGAEKKVNFWYFIQGCLRFLVEQPLPIMHNMFKTRWSTIWLMSLWLMVAVIVTTAYKSKLTSSLISSRAEEPDSVDRLVDLGYNFQISNEDSSVLQEHLRSSADQKFLEALNRSTNNTDFCSSVLQTIGKKIAVIDEETTIQYSVQEECRSLMSLEDQQNLRLVRDVLFPSQHAWPLQLATPYRTRFNAIISHLNAAGIFIKWNSDYASAAQKVPKSHQHRQNTNSRKPKFTLGSIVGPAIIWTLGMIAALIAFVLEILKGPKVP